MILSYQSARQIIFPFLLKSSYDDGFNRRSWSGSDRDGYLHGQSQRQMYDDRTKWDPYGGKQGSSNLPTGGGGGDFLGKMMMMLVVIPLVVVSAVASLFIAAVLILYVKVAGSGVQTLSYGDALPPVFKTTLLYQVLNIVICLLLYWALTNDIAVPFLVPEDSPYNPGTYSYNLAPQNMDVYDVYFYVIKVLLVCQIPSVLFSALMLKSKLSDFSLFNGFTGYLRSVFFTAVVVMPFVLATSYVAGSAIAFYFFDLRTQLFHK